MTATITIFFSAAGFSLKTIIYWLYQKRKYRKHNLQGSYYTEYQDYRDGKHVIIKERVYIERTGLTLSWGSSFGEQSWIFNAEIEDNLLSGYYIPRSVLDSGKGSFLLQINMDGVLLGVWMGFSYTDKLVSQGLYYLKKVPDISIVDYSLESMSVRLAQLIPDTSLELLLSNNVLQNEQHNINAIVALSRSNEKKHDIGRRRKESMNEAGPLLGAAIWSKNTLADIIHELQISEDSFPKHLHYAEKIAFVRFLGIDQKFVSQGIEEILVESLLEKLCLERYEIVFVLLETKFDDEKTALLDLIKDNLLHESSTHSRNSSMNPDEQSFNSESNPIIHGGRFSEVLVANDFDQSATLTGVFSDYELFIRVYNR